MNIYTDRLNWKVYKKSTPYPFAEIDNFIKLDTYKKIKENFPPLNEFKENGNIEANNIQIKKNIQEFSLNKKSFLYEFGSHFVSDEFFYNYCEFFKDEIKYFYPKIYKNINDRNLKIGVSGINNIENFDIILDFQIGINTPVIEKKSVRGAHLDNFKQLYVGLCYLKDSDDYTDSGHFTVFKKKLFNFNKLEKGRSIPLSKLIEIKKIKYKKNRLATFINTRKSVHGVSEREKTNKLRKFFLFNAVINEKHLNLSLLKKVFNRFAIFSYQQ